MMNTSSHLAHGHRTPAESLRRRAALGPGRGRRSARSPRPGRPVTSTVTSTVTSARADRAETQPATDRPRSWWRELALVGVLYVAYAASRLASFAPAGAEVRNGNRVVDLERALHLDPEHALNDWLYEAPRWVSVVASYFYMSMHYLVTAVTLIWLFRTSATAYRRARGWLIAMTFPALIVFWLFPVAPPRTLPGGNWHDIVAQQHQYGWWGAGGGTAPRGFASLVNENAAMPSLHVGWAIWVGYNIVHSARNPVARAFGWAYPLITMTVVIATGNHYLLDVLAGLLLAALAKVFVDRVVPKLRRRRPTAAAVDTPRHERRSPVRMHAHGHRRPLRKTRTLTGIRHVGTRR